MRAEVGTQATIVTTRLSPENDLGDGTAKVLTWVVIGGIVIAVGASVISVIANLLT